MDYSPLGQLHNVPSIAFHLEKLPPNFLSDLKQKALLELDFLRYIDQNRQLYYNEDFVVYSIQRYEKYWLPLVAQISANICSQGKVLSFVLRSLGLAAF